MLIGEAVYAFYRLGGVVGACWLVGVTAVYVGGGIGAAFRSWTTVGPAGISTCWGLGRRGRTHPWQEIRWLDIRQTNTRAGTILAARITLADGRRRSLPALRDGGMYPQPTFHADFRQVRKWWELSTDPATRFPLPDKSPSRVPRTVLAVILILLIPTAVVLFVFGT
ncbi:hypothetical protein AB0E63_39035 [Kribbella sp. NPDC026596]|uniref:hypothetical protein n=1 Tax=Kribbella sp. NPDC026596 TaxID=3155122 RepID=UPI0033D35CCB